MHEAANWSTHASTVAALVSQGADPHRRDRVGETAAEIITRRGLNMTLDGSSTSAGADPRSVLIATPVKSDAPSQKPVPIGCLVDGGGHAAPITLADGNMARAAAPTPTATPHREVVSPTQESPRRGRLLPFGDSVNAAALGRQASADAGESGGGSLRRPGGVSPPRMAGTGAGSTSSTGAPSPLRQSGSLEGLGGTPARKHGASSTASNTNPTPMSDAAAKRAALKAKLERKRQLAAQAKQSAAINGAAPAPMTPSMTMVGPPPTTPVPSMGPPQPSPGKHVMHLSKTSASARSVPRVRLRCGLALA